MGRLLILIALIAVAVLLWKAFGPGSRNRGAAQRPTATHTPRSIAPPKGPDDDPDFLFRLNRDEFKRRRAAEEALRQDKPAPHPAPQPRPDADPNPTDPPPHA